jgi:TolB protein
MKTDSIRFSFATLLFICSFLYVAPICAQTVIYSELQNDNWDLLLHDLRTNEKKVLFSSSENDFQSDYSLQAELLVFDSYRDNKSRNIFIGDLTTNSIKQLTNLKTRDGHPVWSPDGTYIAFQSMRDRNPEVYLMSNDGSEIQRITNSPGFDGIPKWSPDQKFLAFNSSRSGNPGIYLYDLEKGEERPILVDTHRNFVQDWISDNHLLITSTESGLQKMYVLDLVAKEKRLIETDYEVTYARVSADKSRIVFTCLVEEGKSIVYMMDWPSKILKEITDNSTERRFPTFITN